MEKIKEYDLEICESEASDRQLVDFYISDGTENVAWIWGDSYTNLDWECNHPYQCIEFGDNTEQGECKLCGCYCDYHFVEDEEGHKVPESHEWYPRRNPGGLIKLYLDEVQKNGDESL